MLIFTGDINLTDWYFNAGYGIGTRITKGFDPFKNIERKPEDVWIGNFEGVASSVSTKKGFSGEVFRVAPEILKRLDHFEFYGLANNHAMQHGDDAYRQTYKAIQSYGSKCFGTKKQKTIITEHQGQKVSFTGMSLRIDEFSENPLYWHNPEYKDIEEELGAIPNDTFKVLYVHWGNEYINRPSAAQKKFAHWLIDAGFDLIVGMHPHVLQGYEDYHGGRIYYSLGNCVFDMPSEQCKIGALVGLDFVDGKPVYTEQYLHIDNDCCPHVVTENTIPEQWRFEYLNERLKIDDNSEEYHKEINKGYLVYRKANRKQLLLSAFLHPVSFCAVLKDFFKRKTNI